MHGVLQDEEITNKAMDRQHKYSVRSTDPMKAYSESDNIQKWARSCMLLKEKSSANRSTPRFHISTPQYTSKIRSEHFVLHINPTHDLQRLQTSIGKVDEILGPINQVYFTIKPQEGIQATSFKSGEKFYIGGDKLLPLERYAER